MNALPAPVPAARERNRMRTTYQPLISDDSTLVTE